MNWCELTVLNQWATLVFTDESPDFLVVVAFVTEQNIDVLGIALNQRGAIWLSCFRVVVTCRSMIAFTFASTNSVTLSC